METGSGDRQWRQAVEMGSGDRQKRQAVAIGIGDRLWRQVYALCPFGNSSFSLWSQHFISALSVVQRWQVYQDILVRITWKYSLRHPFELLLCYPIDI